MRHLFKSLNKIKNPIDYSLVDFIEADPKYHSSLIDFFKNARGSENHLTFILENLLHQINSLKITHNTILLAVGKIVGFVSHTVFSNHYLWGDGLTVDPLFRKFKLGTQLDKIGEEIARKNNLNQVKIAVTFNNIPILKKMGYSEKCLWYILGYTVNWENTNNLKLAKVRGAVNSDLERIEQFLSTSDYFNISGGMYAEDLSWHPLDRLWLDDLIKKGKILLNDDESKIQGLAIVNKKSLINPFVKDDFSVMEVGYFDGDVAAILDFIKKNYRPNFLRIYSVDGIPLKCFPAEIKNGYFSRFIDLFGGLNRLHLSTERLFLTSIMIMQKTIKNG